MKRLCALFMLPAALALPAHAAPEVVVSIKPIHSLVAGVMQGVGTPGLIVDGAGSPHTYSLKPSQARDIQGADVIFWVGKDLEAFLDKPIDTVGASARVVSLIESPDLVILDFRDADDFGHDEHHDEAAHEEHDGDAHDEHHDEVAHEAAADDGHGHHDHDHGGTDPHIWLDPANAQALVGEIERVLAEIDPANADAYAANAADLNARLAGLVDDLQARLEPVHGRSFVAFHDAYRYFENRFGIEAAGAITLSPEVAPGAAKIAEIRDQLADMGVTCVFAEPQFTPDLITVVAEGSDANVGVLDPLGTGFENGPDLYFDLISAMGDSMLDCLSAGS